MTCRRRSSWAAAGSLRMSTCLMPGELALSTPFQDEQGRINKWSKEMAGFAPLVTGGLKRMVLDEFLPRGPSEHWALHGARLAAIRDSEDFKEGSTAFREKR